MQHEAMTVLEGLIEAASLSQGMSCLNPLIEQDEKYADNYTQQ